MSQNDKKEGRKKVKNPLTGGVFDEVDKILKEELNEEQR